MERRAGARALLFLGALMIINVLAAADEGSGGGDPPQGCTSTTSSSGEEGGGGTGCGSGGGGPDGDTLILIDCGNLNGDANDAGNESGEKTGKEIDNAKDNENTALSDTKTEGEIGKSQSDGDPVLLSSGTYEFTAEDVKFSGDIFTLSRRHLSGGGVSGSLGRGWKSKREITRITGRRNRCWQ